MAEEFKEIRVTVSGANGVGKTAVAEFIARCLLARNIAAVFDPNSLNLVTEGSGITTDEMNKRLDTICLAGNRLVVVEEVGTVSKEDLINLIESSEVNG